MNSVKFAVVAMVTLVILAALSSWTVERVQAILQPGIELPPPWLLGLALANWFIRLEPWLALFGVALVALLGALVSRGTTIAEERRVLLAWLVIAGANVVFELALWAFIAGREFPVWWVHATALAVGFGIVAIVASIVVAVHLQSRLRALGSRFGGRHTAAGAAVLALLGPAVLLLPIAVWVHSGQPQFRHQDTVA